MSKSLQNCKLTYIWLQLRGDSFIPIISVSAKTETGETSKSMSELCSESDSSIANDR